MFKTSFQAIHRIPTNSNSMQSECGNYFGQYAGINNTRIDKCAPIVHNQSPDFCYTSPNRAQKLNNPQNILQRNPAISSHRRSIHVEDPRLPEQFNFAHNLLPDPAAHRTTYRAPTLRANGRSLSARDSKEEFQLETMNGGKWFVCGGEWINKHFDAGD
jgi:hypothetical protein